MDDLIWTSPSCAGATGRLGHCRLAEVRELSHQSDLGHMLNLGSIIWATETSGMTNCVLVIQLLFCLEEE